jgi:hypothetical protein
MVQTLAKSGFFVVDILIALVPTLDLAKMA